MKKSARDQDRVNEAIGAIIRELHLAAATDKSRAINLVKNYISQLRRSVAKNDLEPRLIDQKKTIAQLADCARKLASGIEIFPGLRSQLSLYLSADGSESRMSEWLADLEIVADMLKLWRQLLAEVRPPFPKLGCAVFAHCLIDDLVPAIKLAKTEGSLFYNIASWLWWAVSGEKQEMKRVCDYYIDHLRGKRPHIKGTIIIGMDLKTKFRRGL